jgi:sigma factor regulatory protein, fecR/pupR family
MEISERIRLIKAYLDGKLTPSEENVLQHWLKESDSNRELLCRLRDERLLLNKLRFRERNNKEQGWINIQKKIHQGRRRLLVAVRYAAVVTVVLCMGIIFYLLRGEVGQQYERGVVPVKGGYKAYLELADGKRFVLDSLSEIKANLDGALIRTGDKGLIVVEKQELKQECEEIEYNRIVVPKGGEYKLVLADGTRVWVNSFSDLEFPSQFVGKERRVRLTGEAYFEVSRDTAKPFIVEVGGKEIKVLGTSFNINDYDGKFVTTLVTGRVGVYEDEQEYILEPSMQIQIANGDVALSNVDTREFIAWKEGWFVFKKRRLQDVLDILSRWYDVAVFYQNSELQNLHFTGTIKRHSDIADVLKFLEKTDMVKFTLNGRTLTVSE